MNDQYQELYTTFRWWVPQRFNIAEACCRRWTATGADGRRIAIYHEDAQGQREVWTYARLYEYANRLANGLRRMGVQRGDRVAIILGQRPETVVSYLAVLQMGAIAMPLSPHFGSDALEHRLRHSEARIAIVDDGGVNAVRAVVDRCPMLRQVIGIGTDDDLTLPWRTLIARQESVYDPLVTTAADPALLIYTADATGAPRGVLLPHAALIGLLPGFVASQNWFSQPGDVFWTPAEWCGAAGLLGALLPTLYFGHPIVGIRGDASGEGAFELMERYQVTNALLLPASLRHLMHTQAAPAERYKLALRGIATLGDTVDENLAQWTQQALGVTLNECFGHPETPWIIGNSHEKWPVRQGSIGRPYPGHQVAVLDADGKMAGVDEIGEIAVNRYDIHGHADPVLSLGYWRDDEATQARLHGGWRRTGDLARVDADGYYWHYGRVDDVFKVSGYAVGPADVEHCLMQHPAVIAAAVVPAEDAEQGTAAKAYVVRKPDPALSDTALATALRDLAAQRLSPHETPTQIEFVTSLPVNAAGKLRRQALWQASPDVPAPPAQAR